MVHITHKKIAEYNGNNVIEYILSTESGFYVTILNYGGIITGIYTPDKKNNFANVVLHNKEFDPRNIPHYGAIIGRIAGRIRNGKFTLNDKTYQLAENRKSVHLHGGNIGFDKKIWSVEILNDGISLHYTSNSGEENYPGKLDTTVSYRIINDSELLISYEATTDEDTIINLTNHSYFDLSCGIDPLAMELSIPAEYVGAVDETGCVTGELLSVVNTPFDFRKAKSIKQDIGNSHEQLSIVNGGYDHPYILNDNNTPITLQDKYSGRFMQISTSEPCCVFYSGNWHNPKHVGICLETQRMPNAINWPEFRNSVILKKGQLYISRTSWKFGVNK